MVNEKSSVRVCKCSKNGNLLLSRLHVIVHFDYDNEDCILTGRKMSGFCWIYGFDQGSYLDVMYVDTTGKFLKVLGLYSYSKVSGKLCFLNTTCDKINQSF